jgi:hypothetical protein
VRLVLDSTASCQLFNARSAADRCHVPAGLRRHRVQVLALNPQPLGAPAPSSLARSASAYRTDRETAPPWAAWLLVAPASVALGCPVRVQVQR